MSHQTISFIKSATRILGYMFLPVSLGVGAVILVMSEVLGIYEEVGQP